MYRSRTRTATAVLPLALLLLGACHDESPTSPEPSLHLSRSAESFDPAPRMAVCPTTQSYRTTGVVGPAGGSLQVAGHRLTIPAGLLTEPTRFRLYAPAGRHVRLELSAAGARHYEFSSAVAVTISYDRCPRQHPNRPLASAWYVDDTMGQPLERMGGNDDRRRRAVTFRTTHFSTYIVAF